jgi:protein-disulfide isomerase
MANPPEETKLTPPVSEERDHIEGSPTASVTLVEYGDFECSHCGEAYPILKILQDRFGDDLRKVYRHFPLTEIHPHAQRAAEASEAANAQGQFWEMHDMLFENQDVLDEDSLAEYAAELGLELPRFVRELVDGEHTQLVREDFMSGVRSGVNGTPTFFINGWRHDGPWDLDSLIAAIEGAMKPQTKDRRRSA